MSTSFKRNISSDEWICGTKMSAKGMQSMTSTGIPSLDHLFGGGFALNSCYLLEEDKHCVYSSMITKCFISDAIDYNHKILISSPNITSIKSRFLKELPTRSQLKKESNRFDEMKIAFRYQSLPVLDNNSNAEQFDFGSHVSEQTLNDANIEFSDHNSCLNYIKSLPINDKNVTRIVIEGLGSPLSPLQIESLPKFVFDLKSLVRKLPNVLCLITFCSQIINESNYSYVRNRIHNIVDCVIQLVSFNELTQTPYTEYNGLFNIIKLPKLNSLNYYSTPETLDLGFQLKNNSRFLVIDKLCLPPDLAENVSRTTGCAQHNKSLDF